MEIIETRIRDLLPRRCSGKWVQRWSEQTLMGDAYVDEVDGGQGHDEVNCG